MDSLLKGNFIPKAEVKKEEEKPDSNAEYRRRALESVGGSMVFVERERLFWDGK